MPAWIRIELLHALLHRFQIVFHADSQPASKHGFKPDASLGAETGAYTYRVRHRRERAARSSSPSFDGPQAIGKAPAAQRSDSEV